MPNPIIDGVTIGGTTYDLKDPNLTEEVTELKSAINAMGLCVYNGQFYVNPNGNSAYVA